MDGEIVMGNPWMYLFSHIGLCFVTIYLLRVIPYVTDKRHNQ